MSQQSWRTLEEVALKLKRSEMMVITRPKQEKHKRHMKIKVYKAFDTLGLDLSRVYQYVIDLDKDSEYIKKRGKNKKKKGDLADELQCEKNIQTVPEIEEEGEEDYE